MPLLGYFITVHTYGTWLHGQAKGSVDKDHNTPNTERLPPYPVRLAIAKAALKYSPIHLDAEQRYVVDAAIREVCEYRKWSMHALNVRTTHWHVVATANGYTPERVMNDFKAYSTRGLRTLQVMSPEIDPWDYHGSTRYLNTPESFARAIEYVLHEQGPRLEMRPPKRPAR